MKYIKNFEHYGDRYKWPLSEEETFIILILSGDKYIPTIIQKVKDGADINCKDRFGVTGIIYVANVNQMNMVETLIDLGADWNIKHQGKTFLDELNSKNREYIINKYPENYKEYLIKKEAEKYNL